MHKIDQESDIENSSCILQTQYGHDNPLYLQGFYPRN